MVQLILGTLGDKNNNKNRKTVPTVQKQSPEHGVDEDGQRHVAAHSPPASHCSAPDREVNSGFGIVRELPVFTIASRQLFSGFC
jgi:hypothetical protein